MQLFKWNYVCYVDRARRLCEDPVRDHFVKKSFLTTEYSNWKAIFHHFMKSELIPIVKRLMRRYLDRMWKITTIDQFKFFSEMMPMMNNQDFGRNIRHLKLLTFGQSVVLTPDLTQSWFFQLNKKQQPINLDLELIHHSRVSVTAFPRRNLETF